MAAASPRFAIPPPLLMLISMVSIQVGAAIAKPLFPELGSTGVTLMRLGFAAPMLMLIQRPRWERYSPADYQAMVKLGLSLALMNGFYYAAIARIPIGIAVTLEFIGPLGVALAHFHRRLDLVWVALAAVGVLLLTPTPGSNLDPWGVIYALIGALGWAAYILFSADLGKSHAGDALAIAMAIATLPLVPLGIASGGAALLQPRLLAMGALVALLSSVITYSCEFAALRRLPVRVFGVLLSLEPAIASLIGFGLLGEVLSLRSMVAVALVSIAAAGSAASHR